MGGINDMIATSGTPVDGIAINHVVFQGSREEAIDLEGNDISITNSSFVVTDNGVEITGDDALVSGNTFRSTNDEAIQVYGDRGRIENNEFFAADDPIEFAGDQPTITGNRVHCAGDGSNIIDVDCMDSCTGGTVSNNFVGGFGDDAAAMRVVNAVNFIIEDNELVAAADKSLDFYGENSTIRGNTLLRAGSESEKSCLEVRGNGANRFVNNVIQLCTYQGIRQVSGDGNIYRNNRISDTGHSAIYIENGDSTRIRNNTISGADGEGIANGAGARSAVRVLGLALALLSISCMAAPEGGGPDMSHNPGTVQFADGRLRVEVEGVPLDQLLERIGSEAGLEVRGAQRLHEPVSRRFEDLPLAEAIPRVLNGAYGFTLLAPEIPEDGSTARGGTLWILGEDASNGPPAVSGRQRPGLSESTLQEALNRPLHERRRTLDAAIDAGGPVAVGHLREALADPDAELRKAAIEALGELDDESAARALARALEDPNPELRLEALKSLARIGNEDAAYAIATAMDDYTDANLRIEAIKALSELGSDAAVEGLQQGLDDPDENVREMAREGLRNLVP